MMPRGSNGSAENAVEALKWFRKAADQGNAYAQDYLGFMYSNGRGTSKNEAEAAKWYGKAAAQGYKKAEEHLKALLK